MGDYQLKRDEYVILEVDSAEKISVSGNRETESLVLTNKCLIWVRRGLFGDVGKVTKFPLSAIPVINGWPNVRVDEVSPRKRSSSSMVRITLNKGTRFQFEEDSDVARRWVESISVLLTGQSSPDTSSMVSTVATSRGISGAGPVAYGYVAQGSRMGAVARTQSNRSSAPVPPVSAYPAYSCARCGARLEFNDRFCIRCGTPTSRTVSGGVVARCARCGATLHPGDRFCMKCGHPANPLPFQVQGAGQPKQQPAATVPTVQQPAAAAPTMRQAKCKLCGAPISGRAGQLVTCPFCDGDQVV